MKYIRRDQIDNMTIYGRMAVNSDKGYMQYNMGYGNNINNTSTTVSYQENFIANKYYGIMFENNLHGIIEFYTWGENDGTSENPTYFCDDYFILPKFN